MNRSSQGIGHVFRCQHCAVRNLAVCGAMSDQQLRRLNEIAHLRKYAVGQTIMSHEEPVTFFANIISGAIKLTKTTADGRQQIVGLLFPPDFLGRAFRRNNPYFAEAASDVELCIFPNEAFERLVEAYPELKQRLFERTLDELDAARDWMLLLGRKTAAEKVASFLLLLARRSLITGCSSGGDAVGIEFNLSIKRADMADYLGLTVETVSRQLTRLKIAGIVKINGTRRIKVPVIRALADAAGQEMSD